MTNEEIWNRVSKYFEAQQVNDLETMAEALNPIEIWLAIEEYRPQVDRQ